MQRFRFSGRAGIKRWNFFIGQNSRHCRTIKVSPRSNSAGEGGHPRILCGVVGELCVCCVFSICGVLWHFTCCCGFLRRCWLDLASQVSQPVMLVNSQHARRDDEQAFLRKFQRAQLIVVAGATSAPLDSPEMFSEHMRDFAEGLNWN